MRTQRLTPDLAEGLHRALFHYWDNYPLARGGEMNDRGFVDERLQELYDETNMALDDRPIDLRLGWPVPKRRKHWFWFK